MVPPSFAAALARQPLLRHGPQVGDALSSANGARSVRAYFALRQTDARRFSRRLAGPFGVWQGTGSHHSRLSEPARTRTRPGRHLYAGCCCALYRLRRNASKLQCWLDTRYRGCLCRASSLRLWNIFLNQPRAVGLRGPLSRLRRRHSQYRWCKARRTEYRRPVVLSSAP